MFRACVAPRKEHPPSAPSFPTSRFPSFPHRRHSPLYPLGFVLHPHHHQPYRTLHLRALRYCIINWPFERGGTATTKLGAIVLILDIHIPIFIATTTPQLPPPKQTRASSQYGAHPLPTPSHPHTAGTLAWRHLRAVFTAPIEQSGRPTRYSPSPTEPTDQARHHTNGLVV
jgi:hypothetical protein